MTNATESYLSTLLWTSTNDDGQPLDDIMTTDELPSAVEIEAETDLEDFAALCTDALGFNPFDVFDASQVAHDFCLSRNGHGAGFFDRDYTHAGQQYAGTLQRLARTFGTHGLTAWTDDAGNVNVEQHN